MAEKEAPPERQEQARRGWARIIQEAKEVGSLKLGQAQAAIEKLVKRGHPPIAGGATPQEVDESLKEVPDDVRKKAEYLGRKLDAAIVAENKQKIGEHLDDLGLLVDKHPELKDFYFLKREEATEIVKPGEPTKIGKEKKAGGEKPPKEPKEPERPPIEPIIKGRRPEDRPAVCLSDLTYYRRKEFTLPSKRASIETEEGTSYDLDPQAMNTNQAVRRALELIHEGILTKHTFSTITKTWIERYVSRVKELEGERDPRHQALQQLAQGVFNLQQIIYDVWQIDKGAKGGKHEGAKQMIAGVTGFHDAPFWAFLQDPEIAEAMMRIKGSVSDDHFTTGKRGRRSKTGEDLGDIKGGEKGSTEKIGYYLRMFSLLGGLDGPDQVFNSSYTAYVLWYPWEYFKRPLYQRYQYWILGEGFSDSPRDPEKATKQFQYTHDTKICPSTFHNRGMVEFIWDNFTQDNLGLKNIGRMLALLEGPAHKTKAPHRDPRWRLYGQNFGVYTLRDFLLASEDQQTEMAKAAYELYTKGPEGEEDWQAIQKRILKVNLYRTYYFRELTDKDRENGKKIKDMPWKRKAVLDFGEADEKGNPFVDIGSFEPRYWNSNLSGNILNSFWTDVEYAYRTQVKVLDPICQANPKKYQEFFSAAQEIMTAENGFRHLSEELPERGAIMRDLGYEREKEILEFWDKVSGSIELSTWENRRHSRERLELAVRINNYLLMGYDMPRYREEFESCGIYNRDWTNIRTAEGALSNEEKMAKILGKFERPEVWLVWLHEIGMVDKIKKMFDKQEPAVVPDEWKGVGIEDYWEFLAYNAIVSFAGYRVKEGGVFTEQDYYGTEQDHYGNDVSRVRFELDFKPEEERGKGNYWKGLLPQGLSDEEKDKKWDGVREVLVGETEQGRLLSYGALNEPTFSPLLEYFEKMQEEAFVDLLIERYLQVIFDENPHNWVENKWGEHLKFKKRWDTYALIKRQMKYAVGWLSEDKLVTGETGWYVHDQLKRVRDPKTGNWKIKVDDKGLPVIAMSMKVEGGVGWDHIASMSLGSAGVWRPKEELMTPPKHDIDSIDPKEREKARRERYLRGLFGMGDAGQEEQLSALPIFYNKHWQINFYLGRLFDVAYRYEQAINGGENWEEDQCYLEVGDLEQLFQFFDGLEKIVNEDHNWVTAQKERLYLNEYYRDEFQRAKSRLRIPDVRAEVSQGISEEDLLNLQNTIISVIPRIKGLIPGLRSSTEAVCFLRAAGLSGIALATAAGAAGVFTTIGGTVVALPAILAGSLYVGSLFIDKGVDKRTGKEKAGALAGFLGGYRLRIPKWGGIFTFGMIGKRIQAREPANMARGWEPVWDSALPIDEIMAKIILQYREKLRPTGIIAEG